MSPVDRAEINRRNAQKSTGPRTAEGKNRARMNALKHGMTASLAVLPGENAELFQARVDGWVDILQPRSDVEQYLVERAAQVSWQLDRVNRAHVTRLTASIVEATNPKDSPDQEEDVVRLGRLLFWDRRGPVPLYPTFGGNDGDSDHDKPRTSWSGLADDPADRRGW